MPTKRFLMNAGRTTKQGQQVNVGKDYPEDQAIVSTLTMHPDDMRAVGVAPGGTVQASTPYGEAPLFADFAAGPRDFTPVLPSAGRHPARPRMGARRAPPDR